MHASLITGHFALDGCRPGCDSTWVGDGECDEMCNVRECDFDGSDCFSGFGECYTKPNGVDYRGSISVTANGLTCQPWSHQLPHLHQKTPYNYPDAGLGGHNHCRNPDGDIGPWCLTMEAEPVWEYCTVPPPSPTGKCNASLPVVPKPNITYLPLNTRAYSHTAEHRYRFFDIAIPKSIYFIKAVVVPLTGDPDIFLSFDVETPTGANYTFQQDLIGVDVFEIGRYSELFCGKKGPEETDCRFRVGVVGFETTDFMIQVFGADRDTFKAQGKDTTSSGGAIKDGSKKSSSMLCAPGCEWRSIGDGICNPQCNNTACFMDRQDCEAGSTGCPADCHPSWIGDGYCDEACFNARCHWDRRDCLAHGQKACADGCMPTLLGDGECDAPCNTQSCNFDHGDCFHGHTECYQRADAADYRGMVSRTKDGLTCQRWSDQTPNAHTKTHANFPRAGLGGHNYCRNPDGETGAYCFTTDDTVPWGLCDVGEPSQAACYSPPSPNPPPPPSPNPPPPPPSPPPPQTPPPPPPPPPSPSPHAPPPIPCPSACSALGGNGVCDVKAGCNTTSCLWDAGDCGDVLAAVLASSIKAAGGGDRMVRIGEIVALQGGYIKQGIYVGMLVGLCAAICCLIVYCQMRAKQKKLMRTNSTYTPYGQQGDDFDGMNGGARSVQSAVDDEDDHLDD